MKTNMGKFDRVFRILAAITIAILYYYGVITGTLAVILLIIAVAFVLTSFIGFCPLYLPFGLSTKNKKDSPAT